jgi:hypothetical protein
MPTLTRNERNQLYLTAWQGAAIPESWLNQTAIDILVKADYVRKTSAGCFEATQEGLSNLSLEAQMALQRPRNYAQLSPQAQWDIDQELGILDWDGG